MNFSRLRLHGFKSFCDSTELVMEPGLTGIVGPNGCGKSNLVEALRWVMGESSYKAMRAAGMDEVIFSGSGGRPARNTAEVTLVLDNADRTAPAALNSADILEVTRRIEREAGSVYRVNGREVRARDVQLLFADASTGAHSPALVRQGQIGELIAAKPTARRALLEEAAGISGLHSRRHEAELRLRAAEHNLERVDDIVGEVEAQLETLRRQARLAVRYRALSGEIRRAEATLFHLRWVAARFAEKDTEAQHSVLIRGLADATHLHLRTQHQLAAADAALQPLRHAEAASGAALQRLTILSEQLSDDLRRATQRQAELADRLRQLAADGRRERDLLAESQTMLSAYRTEEARLVAEGDAARSLLELARTETGQARAAVATAEAEARLAADALVQLRAQRAQTSRSAEDARTRVARLTRQLADVAKDTRILTQTLQGDATLQHQRAALAAAQTATAEAETQAIAAETACIQAQGRLDAARPHLAALEAALGRLEAEAATLARMLDTGAGLWPAIVDTLKVSPGYETALGAALGDDLEASADAGAPLHWAAALDGAHDPALPPGAEPLARHVAGSDLLVRRLGQIGLVDAADGPGLMHRLKPGQRLVTRDGALWRWDGFVAAADAPSAAAMRLSQRHRLAELDADIGRARAERAAGKRDVDALAAILDAARRHERERRDHWRAAQHAIGAVQSAVDQAQRAIGDLASRRGALEEARVRLAASLAEAEALRADAEHALAALGDTADAAALAQARQSTLAQARALFEQAQRRLAQLETAAGVRDNRLEQIGSDQQNWQRRLDGAQVQLATLEERTAAIEAQVLALPQSAAGFADRRAMLDAEIETARIAHKGAADSLNVAQTGVRDADRASRLAGEALASARVELGRIEERLKGHIVQRQQIERQVSETLGIEASRTLEASGIRAEQALPAEAGIAQKLDQLKAERERLGGVNLTAEQEAEAVREKRDLMVRDRDDLIEAIAKLRSGIQSLNREGRARLSEAFEAVNASFQELFATLFGGGTAELRFVDSDDPLEAGLEIFACPPGKRPQTMTLLSGGEQALTAMSLIFAVFLTNPAPICVLDEVDAPLDDANVERFCNLLDSMRQRTKTRFMVITHNPITMSRVDRLFGVTMAERGVSQLVSVDLTTAATFLEAV